MQYREETKEDVLIVRIDEPRVDTNVAPEFKTEILRLVQDEGQKKILIDLKKVDYVDSSGLGALLFGQRQAKTNSGTMKLLVNLNSKVVSLIRIAKLNNVLEGFDDEDEAIASFQEES
jgi:anti-sigma B factor antagonist